MDATPHIRKFVIEIDSQGRIVFDPERVDEFMEWIAAAASWTAHVDSQRLATERRVEEQRVDAERKKAADIAAAWACVQRHPDIASNAKLAERLRRNPDETRSQAALEKALSRTKVNFFKRA